MSLPQNFYEKMLSALAERGMNPRGLAKHLGVRESVVYRWKDGVHFPTVPQIVELAGLTGKPIEHFVDDSATEGTLYQTGLSEDEQMLLRMIRKIGPETALERLLGAVPSTPPPGQSYGEIREAEARKKGRKGNGRA